LITITIIAKIDNRAASQLVVFFPKNLHNLDCFSDDAGYFFCSAYNRLGKAHAQVELVVVDRSPVQVNSEGAATSQNGVNISCSVAVDCATSSDCPEAFFKWTFDNRTLNSLKGLQDMMSCCDLHSHIMRIQMSSEGVLAKAGKIACVSLYGEDTLELAPKPQLPAPVALKADQEQQTVRLAWRKPNTHRDIRNHAVSGETSQSDAAGGYLVEFRTKKDRQWRPTPREAVAEAESQSVTLDGLSPNTLYQFRVRAVDSATTGDPSAPTTWIRTPPAAPNEAVEGLRWKTLDNSTIFVEWNPVETVHSSGEHLRYRLSWSLEDNGSIESITEGKRKFHTHHLETRSPQAIVKMNATDDCRMLVFSVRPVNDQGVGQTSTDTVVFLNNRGETRRVHLRNATVLNSTHASFSWEWDKENECGRTRAVQLNCSSNDSDPIVVAVSAEFSEWTLGGLDADTKYTCTLRPFDNEGHYNGSDAPVEITTKQRPPADAPTINKLLLKTVENDVGYTTIIEWSAIDFPHPNITDTATGYKVSITTFQSSSSHSKFLDVNECTKRKPSQIYSMTKKHRICIKQPWA
ncbi:fibronectin type III domain protein, partial [Oesophagostomum dentatum]